MGDVKGTFIGVVGGGFNGTNFFATESGENGKAAREDGQSTPGNHGGSINGGLGLMVEIPLPDPENGSIYSITDLGAGYTRYVENQKHKYAGNAPGKQGHDGFDWHLSERVLWNPGNSLFYFGPKISFSQIHGGPIDSGIDPDEIGAPTATDEVTGEAETFVDPEGDTPGVNGGSDDDGDGIMDENVTQGWRTDNQPGTVVVDGAVSRVGIGLSAGVDLLDLFGAEHRSPLLALAEIQAGPIWYNYRTQLSENNLTAHATFLEAGGALVIPLMKNPEIGDDCDEDTDLEARKNEVAGIQSWLNSNMTAIHTSLHLPEAATLEARAERVIVHDTDGNEESKALVVIYMDPDGAGTKKAMLVLAAKEEFSDNDGDTVSGARPLTKADIETALAANVNPNIALGNLAAAVATANSYLGNNISEIHSSLKLPARTTLTAEARWVELDGTKRAMVVISADPDGRGPQVAKLVLDENDDMPLTTEDIADALRLNKASVTINNFARDFSAQYSTFITNCPTVEQLSDALSSLDDVTSSFDSLDEKISAIKDILSDIYAPDKIDSFLRIARKLVEDDVLKDLEFNLHGYASKDVSGGSFINTTQNLESNQDLSERRAKIYESVLLALGVPASNIGTVTGEGVTEYFAPGKDKANRVQNQRVTLNPLEDGVEVNTATVTRRAVESNPVIIWEQLTEYTTMPNVTPDQDITWENLAVYRIISPPDNKNTRRLTDDTLTDTHYTWNTEVTEATKNSSYANRKYEFDGSKVKVYSEEFPLPAAYLTPCDPGATGKRPTSSSSSGGSGSTMSKLEVKAALEKIEDGYVEGSSRVSGIKQLGEGITRLVETNVTTVEVRRTAFTLAETYLQELKELKTQLEELKTQTKNKKLQDRCNVDIEKINELIKSDSPLQDFGRVQFSALCKDSVDWIRTNYPDYLPDRFEGEFRITTSSVNMTEGDDTIIIPFEGDPAGFYLADGKTRWYPEGPRNAGTDSKNGFYTNFKFDKETSQIIITIDRSTFNKTAGSNFTVIINYGPDAGNDDVPDHSTNVRVDVS